jgi:hypothetical protein
VSTYSPGISTGVPDRPQAADRLSPQDAARRSRDARRSRRAARAERGRDR